MTEQIKIGLETGINEIYGTTKLYTQENKSVEFLIEIPPAILNVGATVKMLYKLPSLVTVLTDNLEIIDGYASFKTDTTFCAVEGDVIMQLVYYYTDSELNEYVKKSRKMAVKIENSLTIPTP